jgi:hypothetical protein
MEERRSGKKERWDNCKKQKAESNNQKNNK